MSIKGFFSRMLNEPARLGSVVVSALAVAAAFGLGLDAKQVAAITTLVGVIAGEGIRSVVVPVKLGEARQAQGLDPLVPADKQMPEPTPPPNS